MLEKCPWLDEENSFFTIEWDASHWLNLAITHVREKSHSAKFFKTFLERVNCFPDMFARGRGLAEFNATFSSLGERGAVVSRFSTTR